MKKSFEKIYDINLSTEVETPHRVWGKPLAGGPVSVLFVPNIPHGREVIEMAQRFDIKYETVLIDRNWDTNKWGLGDFYHLRASIWDDELVLKNLEYAVCSEVHYDVMFIPGINGWRRFTEKTKNAILERVKNGAGLIINQPQHGVDMPKTAGTMPAVLQDDRPDGGYRAPVHNDPWLSELCPLVPLHEERYRPDGYANIDYDVLKHDDWEFLTHYITKGFPTEEIDYKTLGYYPYEAAGDVIIRSKSGTPIAAVKTVGKGRVLALGYLPTTFCPNVKDEVAAEGGCFDSVTMANITPEKNVSYDTGEYFYSLLGRFMLWAANRDKSVITSTNFRDGFLHIEPAESGTINYRIKNKSDELIASGVVDNEKVKIPEGHHGDLRFELLAETPDGDVLDWYTAVWKNPVPVGIEFDITNEFADKSFNVGESLKTTVTFSGKVPNEDNITWVVSVIDDFENVLWTCTGSGEGSQSVDYVVEPTFSLNLRVQAKVITADGFTLVKKETPRVVAVPSYRGVNDFEAFLSPMCRGTSDLMNFIGERMRGLGVTGLFPGGNRFVAPSGAEGLGVYWYKRAGYIETKENYMKTGDKKYLIRVPCLSNSEFWQNMEDIIGKTVTKARKMAPISYFANDEGSLTCYRDELEFCFCDYCMSGMKDWLKDQYGSLEKLNEKWQTDFIAWDAVIPDTYDEAYTRNLFRSWNDHRLYMEQVFAGAYAKMIQMVRKYDPEGVLRMSGCQESSPYTGCDYYELHKHVGYFEAYDGGNQLEFHRSFIRPNTIMGGWTGYGVSGANARHQIWFRTLHGLTLHSIFFYMSNLNPDYTYPKTALDLSEHFLELRREGIGKLLLHASTRDALGIAIHYSMRSVHGAYAKGNEKKFSDNRTGWVNILEDCGYQYNFIATQQIETGELQKYKVLVLPYSNDFSEKEVDKIRAFAKAGGTVIADFQTGVFDLPVKHPGVLDDIFGIQRRNNYNRQFNTCTEIMCSRGFDLFDVPGVPGDYGLPGFLFAEEGVRMNPGVHAAYYQDFAPELPAVVVNKYEDGRGVYLNIAMDVYPELRKSGDGGDMRKLLQSILSYAGIEKFCTLSDPKSNQLVEAGHETIYYSAPGAKYIAILRDLHDDRMRGHDGLVVGGSEELNVTHIEDLRVSFPEKAHIYDVRKGQYFGETSSVDIKLDAGDAAVLAVLPEKLEKIALCVPEQVSPGSKVTLDISAVTNSGTAPASSVFAITVVTPSGRYAWEYSENLACAGIGSKTFRLPYNAEPGSWTIKVKDAATGVKEEKKMVVL